MGFQVIPALELRGGRVVQARRGTCARETVLPEPAVEWAQRFADAGADWLHVVNLDGMRSGRCGNLAVLEAIASAGALKLQAGGGVRTTDDLRRLFAAGAARVTVAGVAVRNPYATAIWINQFGPERVLLALAARRQAGAWRLPLDDTRDAACVQLDALAAHYVRAGARHVLCTDLAPGNTLNGFDLDLYRNLAGVAPDFEILAADDACTLADIRRLHTAGLRGVVVGRPLLEGRFTLREAMRC